MSRQAVDKRLRTFVTALPAPALTIPVSSHTFRHSFAINCLLHGRDIRLIQAWLGHRDLDSTRIYTEVLVAETGHLMEGIQF